MSLLFVIFMFVGCASSPANMQSAKKISLDSDSRYANLSKENTASIIIIRDSGGPGFAANIEVLIDKHKLVSLGTEEYTEFFLKPGNYYIGLRNDITGESTEKDIMVKDKDKLEYRIQMGGSEGMALIRKE